MSDEKRGAAASRLLQISWMHGVAVGLPPASCLHLRLAAEGSRIRNRCGNDRPCRV